MLISGLCIFTIANKVIISLLLFLKRNNSLPNKVLSILIFLPSLTVLSNFLLYLGEYRFGFLVFANQIGVHLLSGGLYLYCLMMMGKKIPLTIKSLIYFITTIIPAGCWMFYELYYSESEQIIILEKAYSDSHFLLDIMNIAGPATMIFYMSLSLYKVHRHNLNVGNAFSEKELVKLNWLNSFISLMLLLVIFLSVAYLFFSEFMVEVIILPVLSNIFYFYIVYQSFNNSVLFTEKEFTHFQENLSVLEEMEIEKYQKSSLTQHQIDDAASRLMELLKNEKLFLDPDLTIQKLAQKTDLSPNKLSEIINRRFHQNFFDFINTYRVLHAQECLANPRYKSYTLEAIAEESGFGSKTAFNRAFKKVTGKTPSGFKKHQSEPVAG